MAWRELICDYVLSRYLAGSNISHAITARNTCTPYSKNGSSYLFIRKVRETKSLRFIQFAIKEFYSSQASDKEDIS